jgi:hypothetical protein
MRRAQQCSPGQYGTEGESCVVGDEMKGSRPRRPMIYNLLHTPFTASTSL